MDNFSVDLMLKIFIRIPVKSLLKLRRVSKYWCNIIDDPFFARMHDYGQIEQHTLLVGIFKYNRLPLPSTTTFYAACDDEEARVIHEVKIPMAKFQVKQAYGSCNGLMYFAEDQVDEIVVSNPLTSQFRILPPLNIEMDGYLNSESTATGLGFDSLTKTFKMVRSYKSPLCSYFTRVHTLGTASWREVSSVPDDYCYCDKYESVFVHGFLHWRTRPNLVTTNYEEWISAFDVSKETFKVIPSPEIDFEKLSGWTSEKLFGISDIKGNLAMLDLSCSGKIDIWVMEYEKQLWAKEYTIDITILGNIFSQYSTHVIGLWKQDEILFHSSRNYWSYSMKNGGLKECAVQISDHATIYSLRGSLISIPGAMEIS
ncbi:F-box domain-containing protein [Heracleum sosnowskyi]|uniref:F-box domain-containing protein n=1 Tax=Heracleum sosnowskyi TaxID=360622 RepID=A0AAD8N5S6_9APIA|nr:F-box domain-containing protein [Heracleum sosnowskyi]